MKYIIKKKTEPVVRVVPDPERTYDQEWKFEDGSFYYRVPGNKWIQLKSFGPGCTRPAISRLKMWAELQENSYLPGEETTVILELSVPELRTITRCVGRSHDDDLKKALSSVGSDRLDSPVANLQKTFHILAEALREAI